MERVASAMMPIDLARAVVHVADQRMTEVLEMPAHLVQPASLRLGQHQRAAIDARAREQPVARDGRYAFTALAARDRMFDRSGCRRRAPHQRQVTLLHPVVLERLREHGRRVAGSREHQRAARAAIQAVYGMYALSERIAHAKQRDVPVVVPTAMHEQPGRLVRDHDVGIDVQEVDAGLAHEPKQPSSICTEPFGSAWTVVQLAGHSSIVVGLALLS